MKILVFGGSGQLGLELQRSLCTVAELIVPGFEKVRRVDFNEPEAVAALINDTKPDFVVNAAAYTAVDGAEADQASAERVNAQAPGAIGRAAAKIGARVIHYSTDYVFSGAGSAPWREEDGPQPINCYGRSKLEGERQLVLAAPDSLIFRTSWVYSLYRENFPKAILRRAHEKNELTIVNDQIGSPTAASFLADATAHAIVKLRQSNKMDWAGIYHLAAQGHTSRYDFADYLLTMACELKLLARMPKLTAIQTSTYKTPAERPLNSRLNTCKFLDSFGIHIPSWQLGVDQFLRSLSAARD